MDSNSSWPARTRRASDTPGTTDFRSTSQKSVENFLHERSIVLNRALVYPEGFRLQWTARDAISEPVAVRDLWELAKMIRTRGGMGWVTECVAGSTIEVGHEELAVVAKS